MCAAHLMPVLLLRIAQPVCFIALQSAHANKCGVDGYVQISCIFINIEQLFFTFLASRAYGVLIPKSGGCVRACMLKSEVCRAIGPQIMLTFFFFSFFIKQFFPLPFSNKKTLDEVWNELDPGVKLVFEQRDAKLDGNVFSRAHHMSLYTYVNYLEI